MKRLSLAAIGALLVLALVPAAALGAAAVLDQDVEPGAGSYLADWSLTQTFTAGLSGDLTMVEMHCVSGTGGDAPATLSVGAETATGTCSGEAAGWASFVFASPPSVTAGTQYTITFGSDAPTYWSLAAAAYDGGEAADGEGSIEGDFAFRTYVATLASPPPTTTATSEPAPSGEAPMWWLPIGLIAGLSSLVLVGRRQAVRGR